MTRSQQLASRFKEVVLDGKWVIPTNIKEQLNDVTLEQALKKIGDHHSIAEITFHINYFIGGMLNVLKGGELEIQDKFSFDMPDVKNEEDWNYLKNELYDNAEQFVSHVNQLTDEQLGQTFVKEEYGSFQRNVDAIIEHTYYHFGQINLLKKLIIIRPQ